MGYRETSLTSWETSAEGWAAKSRGLSEDALAVTDWLVGKVAPRPGDTILELAAGAGETGYRAAELVAPGGRVITTDFAQAMLDQARVRASELGVENVEFRVLDAEDMDLADASVDGVLCRYGYMLMADPGAALRETRRVLRPGRRVALATFTPLDRNPWALFGAVLVERGAMPAPEPGAPGIFALTDPGAVEALLTAAGLSEVEIEEIDYVWHHPSFDAYWAWVRTGAGAVRAILDAMPQDDLADYRDGLAARVAPYGRPDGTLAFPISTLAAAATA